MSGGSMDYLYRRVEEAEFRENTPLRRLFRAHLLLVADALHAIEWVDSGDRSPGGDEDEIRAVLEDGPLLRVRLAVDEAREADRA